MSKAPSGDDGKAPVNIVHMNAIHAETVKKEMRHQSLRTNFDFNPRKKRDIFADKPNNIVPQNAAPVSDATLKNLTQSRKPPKQKYKMPMTSSQEYGWDIEDEDLKVTSEVLHRPKESCEITRFMSEYWKHQSQQKAASDTDSASKK